MKKILLMLTIFLQGALIGCAQTDAGNKSKAHAVDSCIQKVDAEKILGQPASLTESLTENKNNVIKLRCTYTAILKIGDRTGHLYCMLENYKDELLAKNVYAGILSQNQNMPNLKKLVNIGSEALRHTDHENFDMIIIRKGNKILRLKVNKITSLTSTTNLKLVAEKITKML